MNCRITAIGARTSSVMCTFVDDHALSRVALQHRPGEGSGAPS
ncbi:hypothetical protein [Pseudaquabacterium terrae]|nr:hypothetical protein [Aquabacterium terrae]